MSRIVLIVTLSVLLLSATTRCLAQEAIVVANDLADDELGLQLETYKEAFLHGSTENSRIRAAILLLRSKDKTARDILLNALSSAENPVAGT
ncbi:MAG: hypothetical protein ABIG61_06865, partial [Planctomycetota bacterium]